MKRPPPAFLRFTMIYNIHNSGTAGVRQLTQTKKAAPKDGFISQPVRSRLSSDRFPLFAGLDRHLPGFYSLGYWYLDVQHAVVQARYKLIQIEPRGHGHGSVELSVNELSVSMLGESFRSLSLALNYELIVPDAYVHIFRGDARQN